MLIPSIDLMGGKIVQLVQGETKALEFDDFDPWIERFSSYPLVQLIDLDAAIGSGSNHALLRQFTGRLACQVGGGIRSLARAQEILETGARRVILGSVLVQNQVVEVDVAQQFAETFGAQRLTFAVDSKLGRVAIQGWRELTTITTRSMMQALEPYCSAFLYTHIDTEGLLKGIPMEIVGRLRGLTTKRLMAAGGIASQQEVDQLDRMGVDAVVGMAIYSGKMKLTPHPA